MAGLINFQDENEVKEYLNNLEVEYSFQCHKEKDPEGKNLRWNLICVVVCLVSHAVNMFFVLFFRVPEARRLFCRSEEKL